MFDGRARRGARSAIKGGTPLAGAAGSKRMMRMGAFAMVEHYPSALAYHIVWTTYGTWLPGDWRGWIKKKGFRNPSSRPRTGTASARAHGGVRCSVVAGATGDRGTDHCGPLSLSEMDPARRQRAIEPRSRRGDGRPRPGRRARPVQGVVRAKIVR